MIFRLFAHCNRFLCLFTAVRIADKMKGILRCFLFPALELFNELFHFLSKMLFFSLFDFFLHSLCILHGIPQFVFFSARLLLLLSYAFCSFFVGAEALLLCLNIFLLFFLFQSIKIHLFFIIL